MSPEKIKLELWKRRRISNMSKIAKSLDCSPTAVLLVIERRSISKRIMEAVAEAIEQPMQEVFPEYFKKASNIF